MTDLFATNNNPTIDPNKNYLEELVGEGKKFKTVEDLARSKLEADTFIERLKGENQGIREDLNTRLRMEEYLEKLTNLSSSTSQQAPAATSNTNTTDGTSNGPTVLTAEQLEELVSKAVSKKDRERIQSQNVETVRNELVRHFGNDYVTKLREATEAIGASEEFMSNLARENPKALLRMVGVGETPNQSRPAPAADSLFSPPRTQVSSTFSPSTPSRNWQHYEKLRKTSPSEYWSPATQNQMFKDLSDLGEETFYS